MVENIKDTITGYHYTNSEAYKSMQTKGITDSYISGFNDFKGIIPSRRFIRFGRGKDLPENAHAGVIEGLLEQKPASWIKNSEFPHLWRYLFNDICRNERVGLLSFELTRDDDAYVVERAHIERELYRKSKGLGESTKESMNVASKNYWDSKVHVLDYKGNYDVPQLAIWSGIEFDRLKVEWSKPRKEVWQEVLDNGW